MESGGNANVSDDHRGDTDEKALLESGELHRRSGDKSGLQNRLPISSKTVVSRVAYFVALASACYIFCLLSKGGQYYFPISYNPLSRQSQKSTESNPSSLPSDLGNVSRPADGFLGGNPSPGSSGSSQKNAQDNLPATVDQETETVRLQKILSVAADRNKNVVITTVNAAWTTSNPLFDLFLESFKVGLETEKFLKHLVVVALDQKAYYRCMELHPHCFALTTKGVDFSARESYFMAGDYVKLVWRKIEVMYTVIQMGYNAIFSDIDIMWFRDPFSHFLEDADIQTACDHYAGSPIKGSSNTGFYYVKSNNRTLQLYKFWLTLKDLFPDKHDQDVFNMMRSDLLIEKTGIKIRLLDTAFYGGFCEPSKDLNLVCMMHANCCYGSDKLHDLRMLIDDWKKYLALRNDEKTKTPQTWGVEGIKCGRRN